MRDRIIFVCIIELYLTQFSSLLKGYCPYIYISGFTVVNFLMFRCLMHKLYREKNDEDIRFAVLSTVFQSKQDGG